MSNDYVSGAAQFKRQRHVVYAAAYFSVAAHRRIVPIDSSTGMQPGRIIDDTCNDDADVEIAAEKMAALMDDLPEPPRPKLPQSRRYLRAAKWGFNEMVERHLTGTGFIFHVIGVVTMLRAGPFALYRVDRTLSAGHRAAISEWWQRTASAPEIKLIKRLRDTALKDAALKSTAVSSSTYIGDGPASEETSRDYGVDHIDLGQRRDMLADLRSLFDWFEAQLSEIEARLPDE